MAKTKKPKDFSKYVVKDKQVFCGLDISLTSPGICIFNYYEIMLYFFPQRKREIGFTYDQGRFHIRALGYHENPSSREQRYERIADDILTLIEPHKDNIAIGIEGYAFGARGRGQSGLMEMGGVLRYKLYNLKYKYIEVPPTTVKSYASNNGQASKEEMVQQFHLQNKDIDLYKVFGLKPSKRGEPPKPVEDVVDAFFLTSMLRGDKITPAPIVANIMNKLKDKIKWQEPQI